MQSSFFAGSLINKTQSDKDLNIKLINSTSGNVQLTTGQTHLKTQGTLEGVLIINLNAKELTGKSTPIEVGIFEGETLLERYSTNFLGPDGK